MGRLFKEVKAQVPLLGYGGAGSLTRAYAQGSWEIDLCLSFGKGIL